MKNVYLKTWSVKRNQLEANLISKFGRVGVKSKLYSI